MFSQLKKGILLTSLAAATIFGAESKSLFKEHMKEKLKRKNPVSRVQTVTRDTKREAWGAEGGWNMYELTFLCMPTELLYEIYAEDEYLFGKITPQEYALPMSDFFPDGWYKSLAGKSILSACLFDPEIDADGEIVNIDDLLVDSTAITESTVTSEALGSDFKVCSKFNDNGMPLSVEISEDESETEDLYFTYDGKDISSMTYRISLEEEGETYIEEEKYDITYSGDNKAKTIICNEGWGTSEEDMEYEVDDSTAFFYTSEGLLESTISYREQDGEYTKDMKTTYTYDDLNRVLSYAQSQWPSGSGDFTKPDPIDSVAFAYDDKGQIIEETEFVASGTELVKSSYYTYEYDTKGNLVTECSYDAVEGEWEIWDSTYYTYDAGNNMETMGWDDSVLVTFIYEDGLPVGAMEYTNGDSLTCLYVINFGDVDAVLHKNISKTAGARLVQNGSSLTLVGMSGKTSVLKLFNCQGKLVYEAAPLHKTGITSFDLLSAKLASGLYMAQVVVDGKRLSTKIKM